MLLGHLRCRRQEPAPRLVNDSVRRIARRLASDERIPAYVHETYCVGARYAGHPTWPTTIEEKPDGLVASEPLATRVPLGASPPRWQRLCSKSILMLAMTSDI